MMNAEICLSYEPYSTLSRLATLQPSTLDIRMELVGPCLGRMA